MFVYKDLGTFTNKESRKIRNGLAIRSSMLYDLNKKEIETVKSLHPKKIIDLRTGFEAGEKPDIPVEGALYLNLPLFKESTLGITRESYNNDTKALLGMPYLGEVYKRMLTEDYSLGMIRKVLTEIMNSEEYPVIFHCTAGKDRTGVITFFLLYMLDVDYETIIADYLEAGSYSAKKAEETYEEVYAKSHDHELAMKVKGFWMLLREYLEDGLDEAIRRYGSIDGYIENGLKIDAGMREAYKKKFLI